VRTILLAVERVTGDEDIYLRWICIGGHWHWRELGLLGESLYVNPYLLA